jgi:uncharacterized repeat protein (TIGR01451 family)
MKYKRIGSALLAWVALSAGSTISGPVASASPGTPTVGVGDVTVVEAGTDLLNARFPVTLSSPQASDVRVSWQVVERSARADQDYRQPKATRVARIKAGTVSTLISVPVLPDAELEMPETFSVVLTAVLTPGVELGRNVATGTILDSPEGPPSVSIGDVDVVGSTAGTTNVELTISLSAPRATRTPVTWTTVAGTALAGIDFGGPASVRTTRIPAGRTRSRVVVPVLGRADRVGDVAFEVAILGTGDTGVAVERSNATVTILDEHDMSAFLSDSFNRERSPLGVSETGQPWVELSGVWSVMSKKARSTETGYGQVVADVGSALGTYRLKLTSVGEGAWAIVRATDQFNYWRFGWTGGGNYVLQRIEGNEVAFEVDALASIAPENKDMVACQLNWLTISCAVNGVDVASSESASGRTATMVGLATFSTASQSSVRFDDVLWVPSEPGPALRVSVAHDASSAVIGDDLGYTMTVTNEGDAPSGAAVVHTLPPSVAFVSAEADDGTCSLDGATVSCEVGPIAPGDASSVAVTVTALTAGLARTGVLVGPVGSGAAVHDRSAAVVALVPDSGGHVLDTFSRPDESFLGTAETGEPWSEVSGTWGIVDGQARQNGSGYTLATLTASSATGSVDVGVGVATREFWAVFRHVDDGAYWRFGHTGAGYVLQRIEGGAVTEYTGATVLAADGDVLRIVLLGDGTIDAWVNGVPVVSVVDPVGLGATGFGLAAYRTGVGPSAQLTALQHTPG